MLLFIDISKIELVNEVIIIQIMLKNKMRVMGWKIIFLLSFNPPIALNVVRSKSNPNNPSAGKLKAKLLSFNKSEILMERGAKNIIE